MTNAVAQISISPDVIALQNVAKKIQEVVRMELVGYYNSNNAGITTNYSNYGGLPEQRVTPKNTDQLVTNHITRELFYWAAAQGEISEDILRATLTQLSRAPSGRGASCEPTETHTAITEAFSKYQGKHELESQQEALARLATRLDTALAPFKEQFQTALNKLHQPGKQDELVDSVLKGIITTNQAYTHC